MNQTDIYRMIEDRVIQQLENGIIPWRRCYHTGCGDICRSHQTGRPYSLINQFLLDEPGEYWTFTQAKKAGLRIRGGSKSKKILFWKVLPVKEISKSVEWMEDESDHFRNIPFLCYYNVFHESDIEGLQKKPVDGIDEEERERRNGESVISADQIVDGYLDRNRGISIVTSNRTPCFSSSERKIFIPEKSRFDSIEDYYSTMFHEIIHSTMLKLDRQKEAQSDWRANWRAKEELVAEIGSAYLCGRANITDDKVIKNTSAYCAEWLRSLRNNVKMLIWASSKAEAASRYVLNEKSNESESEE